MSRPRGNATLPISTIVNPPTPEFERRAREAVAPLERRSKGRHGPGTVGCCGQERIIQSKLRRFYAASEHSKPDSYPATSRRGRPIIRHSADPAPPIYGRSLVSASSLLKRGASAAPVGARYVAIGAKLDVQASPLPCRPSRLERLRQDQPVNISPIAAGAVTAGKSRAIAEGPQIPTATSHR
jgi:hypothetical protein